jgi:hypothetical protein
MMLWVTRWKIRVNRAATGWLVRRFVDAGAEFRFVDPAQVALVEREQGAVGFDANDVRYPHRDRAGRCSFEALVEEHLPYDAALRELGLIVHYADFPNEIAQVPSRSPLGAFDVVSPGTARTGRFSPSAMDQAIGLRAIARGFPSVAASDYDTLDRSAFLYDALYASLRERLGS